MINIYVCLCVGVHVYPCYVILLIDIYIINIGIILALFNVDNCDNNSKVICK